MKKQLLFTLLIALSFSTFAQKRYHFVPAFEEGLTFPLAKFDHANAQSVVRYTGTITNLMLKNHFAITPKFNVSINTGILNHGFIHNLNDTLKVKQRSYVIPLGGQFTFGNIEGMNFFLGGEVHIPIHYKEKTWIIGDRKSKIKNAEWMSDKTEMLSPLVFLGFQINENRYFQIKYQLGDFLNPNHQFNFRGINTRVTQSNMISFTFGTIINTKNPTGFSKPLDDSKDMEIDI